MLFQPNWYKMLPDSVKPMSTKQIKAVETFRKKYGGNDLPTFMGIITSPWAVARIQQHSLARLQKIMPEATEKELWKEVLCARLLIKASFSQEPDDPHATPLSEEEIKERLENIDEIISSFNSFDDVIQYILAIDEQENRFFDPTGLKVELNNALQEAS